MRGLFLFFCGAAKRDNASELCTDCVRGGEAYDVFLSYSRADSAAAETLRARQRNCHASTRLRTGRAKQEQEKTAS
jgi:hypothetical protein